jgi:predicted nucleic acid-binding protein
MYLDAAYVAKFYLNEADSPRIRTALRDASALVSSSWTVAETGSAFHRHLREGHITAAQYRELLKAFLDHVDLGFWHMIPVSDTVIRRMTSLLSSLPATLFLRAGDAIQPATASEIGAAEVWTNNRHMLAAASHFGLSGRSA